ncbi:Metal dependent phosphohydrolase [Seminavis robusta]|uniref:Metal dependent phosphohydrolase n=1 Tax=Seminavis robusta TaxID=568900 RepID=A0A9N8F5W2_9STRA|nr:Metal dependent phosphohydrolase [Seminavis robusta]|eukprot:Sro3677_g350210.1 Metal dependent phosphohydrolase (281) ;mRNA; f:876-1851
MSLIRASIALVVPSAAAAVLFPESPIYVAAATVALFIFAKSCSRPLFNEEEHCGEDNTLTTEALLPYSCSSPPKDQQLTLTTSLPAPEKIVFIQVFGGIKLEQLATSIAHTIGLRRIPRAISSIHDPLWAVPTTQASQAALELCQKTAEPYDRDGLDFELLGAQAAQDFCIQQGMGEHKANVVHEMLALHTSPHILSQPQYAPELKLIHQGAGIDVAGLYCEEISNVTKMTVVHEYPRLNFKRCCCALMADHARRKPNTLLAVNCHMGFLTAIKMGPFQE